MIGLAKKKAKQTKNQQGYAKQVRRLRDAIREIRREGYYNVPDLNVLIGDKPRRITKAYISKLKGIKRNDIRAMSSYTGDVSPFERRKQERIARRSKQNQARDEEIRREEQKRKEQEAMGWTAINNLMSDLEANATNNGLKHICERLEEVISSIVAKYGSYQVYLALENYGWDKCTTILDFVLQYPSDEGVIIVEYRVLKFIQDVLGVNMPNDEFKYFYDVDSFETHKKERKESSNESFVDYSSDDWIVPDNVEDFPW